jgi:class 3 adenylate cyclase
MADTPRRERKVVSVVFCDLVGFTQRAETLDPEDVEAFLGPYHERLRTELERYGGTVEKFIGDAVMALFGAPIAHEDDPERAVRAALAIRDWALESEDVQVRLAVTTGEALIRLDARPEAGEAMASGDVVNTTARLQSAADVNAILVDDTTYRATRHVIDHEATPPVEAKGKSEPIAVWRPRAARARFGVDVAHEARAGLVGRAREVGVLRDAFERARHERVPQLVTLVGVPGIGKSRLVYELSRIVDQDPEIVTWRQGRCLAYGDGVTLWALCEIVKAQVGVLEQDTADEIDAKVGRSVEATLGESGDAARVRSHLLTLLGVGGETELGGDRRSEAFAAWRRYLEGLAEQRPLVLVVEDLHWADESLLDFVDELVDWLTDVPLLVVGTARPELLERRPAWGGGKLNATTLALAPLTDEETAWLLAELLARPVVAAEAQQRLLERAGGNPLYAEQFADLYLERGSTDELPLPETLQGIIAARLDGLREAEKRVMQDASVVGKVFWAGMFQADEDVAPVLHSLERKGFVRRQRRSSVEGESEYAFAHALVRDVAYGQIPRAERAEKHRRTADWIDALGRAEDHAEMLAYHWQSALDLDHAAGVENPELVERTRLALRAAGDRAFALNSYAIAAAQYEDALALWPLDDERPHLLFRLAEALLFAADERRMSALEDARDALLAVGDRARAGEAEALLAQAWWYRGHQDEVFAHVAAAEELVEGAEPSIGVTRVLAVSARYRSLAGDRTEGIRLGRQALAMAEQLSLEELRAHALITLGTARYYVGDQDGERDLEKALEIALAANSPLAATALNNLGVIASDRDMRRELELIEESGRVAERMGDRETARYARGNRAWGTWAVGRWDEALEIANEFIAECESGSPHYLEGVALAARAEIRLGRGEIEAALADFDRSLELTLRVRDPQTRVPALATSARAYMLLGRTAVARARAREFMAAAREVDEAPMVVPALSDFASELELVAEFRELVDLMPPGMARDVASADLDCDFQRSADLFADLGFASGEAGRRLRAAEQLIGAGQRQAGESELQRALAFYRSVGATFFVRRGEELLAATA